MSLDLILAGAAGGVVGATTVLAAQAVSAAVTNLTTRTRATKSSEPSTRTSGQPEPSLLIPHVGPDTEWETTGSTTPDVTPRTAPDVEATAHARLRERQLAEFADKLAGDDRILRERLRRFEGGLS